MNSSSAPSPAGLRPSVVFRCRLCWQIALFVTICIIVIEAIILVPSYVNYERDLLKKLDDVGLAAVQSGFAQSGTATQAELHAAATRLLENDQIAGLAIYGAGGELTATLGERPELTLRQIRVHGLRNLRSQDGTRLSASYLRSGTGLPYDVIAHLDSSQVADEATAFVWRIIGLVLLITFFVSSATMLVVGRLVLRPMLKIREQLVAVQKDPSQADHFALRHSKTDEVGEVVNALNALMRDLSDYRHSEVLAEERRFQDFTDASSDWFWEMDEQLRFSFFSERFTEVTGVAQEDLLGKTRQESGRVDIPEQEWQKHLADLAAHRSFRDFRHPRRKPDGQVAHLSINGRAIFDDGGIFRGYRGTGSDITGRVVAEEALQRAYSQLENLVAERTTELVRVNEQLSESENRYRELFDESPVAIWEEDWSPVKRTLDGLAEGGVADWRAYFNDHPDQLKKVYESARILEISRAAIDLYGEDSREALVRRTYTGDVIAEELDSFLETLVLFRAGQMTAGIEAKDIAGDGSEIVVRRQVVIPPKYRDDWSRVIYAIEDITERTQVQEQLRQAYETLQRETEERERAEQGMRTRDAWLRAILENAPIEIALKDTEGQIMAISRNVTEEQRLPAASFIGTTTADYLPAETAEIYMAADRQVVQTGQALQREVREEVDGKVRYSFSSKFPLNDDKGVITGVCSMTSDITEIKEAEARLSQAQKMEAVGQLTGGVAHDFNNLLAVIQGNAELLATKTEADSPYLQAILRSSKRGSELTHRLLAFSRQQSLLPRPTNLAELVCGMTGMLQRVLGATIEIETSGEPGSSQVMADPGQIENALLNLAINARDAMPEGGKLTIGYQSARVDADYVTQNPDAAVGDYMVLAVSDSGTGMPAEVKARAFEPFFTTKGVGKGSGLGLSMVYGFAQQSGGHVTIYSEEGHGSTVKIYLPLAEGQSLSEAQSKSQNAPLGFGETILIVEDDADVRALAVQMLERLGYRTIAVPDAPSASAKLADGPTPDLVLSDVVLPGGASGPEFAEMARAAHPDLKIIFMSGYPTEAAKRNGLLESDEVLLNKPFRQKQLAEALRAALD